MKRAPYVQNLSLAFLPPAFYNETTKWGKVGQSATFVHVQTEKGGVAYDR